MFPAPASRAREAALEQPFTLRQTAARLFLIPLLACALLLALSDMADAKRMGGGKSFGSKPSYGSGYNKQTTPPNDSFQRQATPGQQAGQQAGRPAAPGQPAPSRFGGIGTMLGGMLMGGLIGSMLFGGGLGGFGGVGLLEILLLVGGGFLLMRFLRSRKTAAASGPQYAYSHGAPESAEWRDVTAEQRTEGNRSGWGDLGAQTAAPSGPAMPAGVDEQEFLSGAKMLFTRLQASWDRRDLNDIREFTSPEVHAEIARQAAADPGPSRTDVLTVEARVVEARQNGSETVISVLFDALLREDQSAAQASQTREVWHFTRDESAAKPQWTLEGIQQLEI